MNRSNKLVMSLALAGLMATAVGASALEPLGENKYVIDRLFAARVADRIRKTCPTIGARLFYAYGEARELKRWAERQGYSREQIDSFLKDKAEKRKIYARAEQYLAAHGAVEGKIDGFCALGYKEIAANSLAGSLIYAK